MLNFAAQTPARLPDDTPPLLAVVVDTEEEFDWARPLDRANTAVTAMRHQQRAHRVFETYGLRPTYVVDYPVASQAEGYRPLLELRSADACEIGAHLHPWVNPPHDEVVDNRNSYPGNLPSQLERAKLQRLTDTIAAAFGERPTVYKAGRYGVGPNTSDILADLGYEIDASVVAWTDFTPQEGPDFSRQGAFPYWFGPRRDILEVPVTAGFAGRLGASGGGLYRAVSGRWGRRLRLPGLMARGGLVERIRLTPEGMPAEALCRLLAAMRDQGHRVFTFTYHSPSLEPGNTPYVQTADELREFLDRFRRVFDMFFGDLGGRPATLSEIRDLADRARGAHPMAEHSSAD